MEEIIYIFAYGKKYFYIFLHVGRYILDLLFILKKYFRSFGILEEKLYKCFCMLEEIPK